MRKKNIPGLVRLREKAEKDRQERAARSRGIFGWCKRNWMYLTSALTGLAGVLAFVLLQGPSALSNAQVLPGKVVETVSMMRSWYYEDAKWSGAWSDMVEGVVGGTPVSRREVYMTIEVKEGEASGTISTKEICKALPYNFIHFRGKISSGELHGEAYDWFWGQEKTAFTFRMRNGVVTPVLDPSGFFPDKAVLDKDIHQPTEFLEEHMSGLDCKYQRQLQIKRFYEQLEEIQKKSAS